MKAIALKAIAASLITMLLSSTYVWAGRTLIQDKHQTVTLNQSLDCYRAAQITVDTRNPEIFEQDTTQLQAIADTARAMISYECPGLDEIEISGLVRGLDETVYHGRLSARNSWLVQPIELAQTPLVAMPRTTAPSVSPAIISSPAINTTAITSETLSLTGLELGMSIAAAIEAVETAFEISPQYDPENGMMTLLTGGCPTDFDTNNLAYDAQSEWKCLKAWFSDKRIPSLERVELIQVINSDALTVKQRLTEKYGVASQNDFVATNRIDHLKWRNSIDAQGRMPSLDAKLSRLEPMLLLTRLTLSDQLKQAQQGAAYADIGLRL